MVALLKKEQVQLIRLPAAQTEYVSHFPHTPKINPRSGTQSIQPLSPYGIQRPDKPNPIFLDIPGIP
jgi:hypothetical protein